VLLAEQQIDVNEITRNIIFSILEQPKYSYNIIIENFEILGTIELYYWNKQNIFFEVNTGPAERLHLNIFSTDSGKPVMEGAKHLLQDDPQRS
jgi:hypothetical protein